MLRLYSELFMKIGIVMLSSKEKLKVINDFKRAEKDTGSPEIQIAIISKNISLLTKHLKKNKKDYHARRGLINMVNQRRKLLDYLNRKSSFRYNTLLKVLCIRHTTK